MCQWHIFRAERRNGYCCEATVVEASWASEAQHMVESAEKAPSVSLAPLPKQERQALCLSLLFSCVKSSKTGTRSVLRGAGRRWRTQLPLQLLHAGGMRSAMSEQEVSSLLDMSHLWFGCFSTLPLRVQTACGACSASTELANENIAGHQSSALRHGLH